MKKSNLFTLSLIIAVLAVIAFLLLKRPDENTTPAEAPATVALTVSETKATEAE